MLSSSMGLLLVQDVEGQRIEGVLPAFGAVPGQLGNGSNHLNLRTSLGCCILHVNKDVLRAAGPRHGAALACALPA